MFSFLEHLRFKKNILTVEASDSIWNVLELMEKSEVGGVLVLKNGSLVGIFTERDLLMGWRKLSSMALKEIPIERIMTKNVKTLGAGKLGKAAVMMLAKKFRHLPVIDDNKIVNFLSIRDVLEMVIQENEALKEEIAELKKGKKK